MTIRPDAFDSELSIQAASGTTWRLTSPLIWTGTAGDTFTVPIGFVTDFATVPRILHWLVLPYGAYTRAAVLHDWLLTELAEWQYQYRGGGYGGRGIPEMALPQNLPPANSRDTDGIFRRAMEDLGVSWTKRWIMWAAVRVAALFNSRRAYGRAFARDLPRVAGLAVLALPVISFGVVGVSISLTLASAVKGLRRIFVRKEAA